MGKQTWTILDSQHGVYVDSLTISAGELPGAASSVRASKRRLQGGPCDGVDVVEIGNGEMNVTVVPTRGMGIWKAECGPVKLGWSSPTRGPVNPALVPIFDPSGLGWLDGFDELLVRCGLQSNGGPEFKEDGTLRYPLHGRIANLPAEHVQIAVDAESGEVGVIGRVRETRLFFTKLLLTTKISLVPGRPEFTVTDTVTNLAGVPGEMELLYHINFGVPLLEPQSRVVLPIRRMAPRDAVAAAEIDRWDMYGPGIPGKPETVYFFELSSHPSGGSSALLHNAAGTQGVGVAFNVRELPCFTLWKNEQPECDGYVTGLEPAVNFPNIPSFEKARGRVVTLEPGQSRSFSVTVRAYRTSGEVEAARAEVLDLQQGVLPQISRKPNPEWSAAAEG
ncbi:MAG: aldose 1-epimerase family protein [Thermogutta sp.]|nr:aldose 1-epimerase family protein [Thermogutta sp.]